MDKPLFIPLKSEYYDAFSDGTKKAELRRYGPRWNENTCRVGRIVTLSKGYGNKNRRRGRIIDFYKVPAKMLDSFHKAAITSLYGTLNIDIAVIHINLVNDGYSNYSQELNNEPATKTNRTEAC